MIGLVVLLNEAISTYVKVSFWLLNFGVVLWQSFILISNLKLSHELVINRLVFFFPIVALTGLLLFVQTLAPTNYKPSTRSKRFDYTLIFFGILITLLPYVVKGITPSYNSKHHFIGYNVIRGPLYPAFLFFLTVMGAKALYELLIYYKKAGPKQARQLKVILYGILLTLCFGIFTNVLLPTLTNNSTYSNFGVLAGMIFIGSIAYSIVRYRFLDIRLAIARTASYVLTISFVATLYGIASYLLSNIIGHSKSTASVIILALLIACLAASFSFFKRLFDKLTNFVFFRDAYDTQIFLNSLNDAILNNIDTKSLLEKASKVLYTYMKVNYTYFYINDEESGAKQLVGADPNKTFKQEKFIDNIYNVKEIQNHTKQSINYSHNIENLPEKEKEFLNNYQIAVIININLPKELNISECYLIIGYKKSGGVFNKQDNQALNVAVSELTIALQNAVRFQQIQEFNVTLQQRVDEATKKLRHANDKLKALDESKDDFISMASHQLRTPLTSIKGYISMVLEGDAGKVSHVQKEMLNQAFFSSQRMVYLIADLLNISRLNTGKFVIEPSIVNLADIVEQELSQLKETAASHSLDLTYTKPKNFPDLNLDETKTRQVIMNFVDNAIYYTPANGHIDVKLINNPDTVELRVEDDGIGVPKSEQPHLFTKFYRAGNARKARPDGTGLGLFMAKKVIAAQGGSIIFESQEGKGSTFGFLFPKTVK